MAQKPNRIVNIEGIMISHSLWEAVQYNNAGAFAYRIFCHIDRENLRILATALKSLMDELYTSPQEQAMIKPLWRDGNKKIAEAKAKGKDVDFSHLINRYTLNAKSAYEVQRTGKLLPPPKVFEHLEGEKPRRCPVGTEIPFGSLCRFTLSLTEPGNVDKPTISAYLKGVTVLEYSELGDNLEAYGFSSEEVAQLEQSRDEEPRAIEQQPTRQQRQFGGRRRQQSDPQQVEEGTPILELDSGVQETRDEITAALLGM